MMSACAFDQADLRGYGATRRLDRTRMRSEAGARRRQQSDL